MNAENSGEQMRICPWKVAKAQKPLVIENPLAEYPSMRMVVPEGADIACESDCPGARKERRHLGPIPLPIQKEICPLNEVIDDAGAHNASILSRKD